MAVELDALPIEILQVKIHDSISMAMDMEALEEAKHIEAEERKQLARLQL
jgi:hypothetical protein